MKSILPVLVAFLITISLFQQAQAQSRGFNYQAVARNTSGAIISNQTVNVRFLIRKGSPSGSIVFDESHSPTTNVYGVFNIEMGKGSGAAQFDNIDWGSDRFFLEVQLNNVAAGTTELIGVPYAKVATDMNLKQLKDVGETAPAADNYLKWNGSQWTPSALPTDGDNSPSNEIQVLSLSGGNTLNLSNGGGSVVLPAGTGSFTAGTGINIASNVISNSGDTNAADDITNATTAGGDLNGTFPNPTVDGIRGVAVSATAPSNGQILKYNGTQWAPSNLESTTSQWTTSGTTINYTAGNVGIGDATPAAALTVGNGDKFQVNGTNGGIEFTDDEASLQFPATALPNNPMMYMFKSGTSNASRMTIAHSPGFRDWGLEYNDTTDVFHLRSNTGRKFSFELGSGDMGIGVENPAFPLSIKGRMQLVSDLSSNFPGTWYQNQAGTFNRAFFGMLEPDSTIGIFSQHLNRNVVQFEVMREPRMGIGTVTPRAEIHIVHTNFGGSNDGLRIQNAGANNEYWNLYTSNTNGFLEFFARGIKKATIDKATGAYASLSDARAKSNITDLSLVLPSVMTLSAKSYQFIDDARGRQAIGFLAQDLERVFPQFVYKGGDNEETYTVDYAGMSVVALKAIQEQQAEIESLKAEVEKLKGLLEKVLLLKKSDE